MASAMLVWTGLQHLLAARYNSSERGHLLEGDRTLYSNQVLSRMSRLMNIREVQAAIEDRTPVWYMSRSPGAVRHWRKVVVEQVHEVGRRVVFVIADSPVRQAIRCCWAHAAFSLTQPTKPISIKQYVPAKVVKLNAPAPTKQEFSDAELLALFDGSLAELEARGIDPIRRVRTVTTEVPL